MTDDVIDLKERRKRRLEANNSKLGGGWHPNYEVAVGSDEYDMLSDRAIRWAVWISEVLEDPDGFGFVAAAVEAFAERVVKEDHPESPWQKYATWFLDGADAWSPVFRVTPADDTDGASDEGNK